MSKDLEKLVSGDRFYTETHEYVKLEEQNVALIGLSAYALKELKGINAIELPKPGEKIEQSPKGAEESKNYSCGTLEADKGLEAIYSPVSGTVLELNPHWEEDVDFWEVEEPSEKSILFRGEFEGLFEEPYGQRGWLLKVEIDPKKWEEEKKNLMTPEEYLQFISK